MQTDDRSATTAVRVCLVVAVVALLCVTPAAAAEPGAETGGDPPNGSGAPDSTPANGTAADPGNASNGADASAGTMGNGQQAHPARDGSQSRGTDGGPPDSLGQSDHATGANSSPADAANQTTASGGTPADGSPGESGDAPGQQGTAGTNDSPPGMNNSPPGQSDGSASNSTPPGHGDTSAANAFPPGQSGDAPPDNAGSTPDHTPINDSVPSSDSSDTGDTDDSPDESDADDTTGTAQAADDDPADDTADSTAEENESDGANAANDSTPADPAAPTPSPSSNGSAPVGYGAGVIAVGAAVRHGNSAVIHLSTTSTATTTLAPEHHWTVRSMAGLYSKHDDSDPLEHDARERLHETIAEAPGTHLSALCERADVSLSTARHHLRVLECEGIVSSAKHRGKRRYFPAESSDQELAAAMADDAAATVLEALARTGPATVSMLADELDRDPSTVTHHLKRLDEDGLIVRERDGRAVVSRLTPDVAVVLQSPAADADAPQQPGSAD